MSKLTLSVEESVISSAKRYAKEHGISVSEMVETYLAAVVDPSYSRPRSTPILNSVRGLLKRANVEDYRRHLAAKYR